MESHKYSGYQADDESFRGVQMGSLHASFRQGNYDWRNTERPPSRCQFRHPAPSCSSPSSFPSGSPGKRKHHRSTADSSRENNHLANEFSEFVDFLADEDVLDSLQSIVEDAVRKLRDMTTDDGERVFDIEEESSSSFGTDSWSYSYSSTCSQSQYYTTSTTSTSEDDWEQQIKSKPQMKADSLLEKYAARLPKMRKKTGDEVSGGLHAETFSERSGDSYFFQQEHLHIWAKLAESFEQLPKRDYFAKFRRKMPQYSRSVESLKKEITSVLKRPTPSSIPLYYPGRQPFDALDFLEEKKILSSLQDIINQAVGKVLDITGMDVFSLFGEEGSEEGSEEGEEGEESSGSGEETSDEDDSQSGSSKSGKKKKKKKKRKGKKKKKKGKASPAGEEKGKGKYTAPLPKGQKKAAPEEPQRKAKYVPPPLPKTKPRGPQEEPPPKPKYTPPPLPKPRQKKDSTVAEVEPQKQVMLTKHIITPKDIKRARLEARPPPKQSIIDFLIENAAKLILYKYNYETLLSEKLGLISVPVTKVLLEIMFGYKKIKGSGIRLSSQIDWTTVYDEIYAVRPRKPKPPKVKAKEKKKAKDKKEKAGEKPKKPDEKKAPLLKPQMPKGKVVVFKSPTDQDVPSDKKGDGGPITQRGDSEGPEIFEIVPPQFPEDNEEDSMSVQPSESTLKGSATPTTPSSPQKSIVPQESQETKLDSLPDLSPKKSQSFSWRKSVPSDSNRGSQTFLPEVEPTSTASGEVSKKGSFDGNGSKTVLPKISN